VGFTSPSLGPRRQIVEIAAILEKLSLRAVDSETGDFFVPGEQAIQSFDPMTALHFG
jgi:hypothetical protein